MNAKKKGKENILGKVLTFLSIMLSIAYLIYLFYLLSTGRINPTVIKQ